MFAKYLAVPNLLALWMDITVISMKGKPEYIILNYLYQFHDFYRGVAIPSSLKTLAGDQRTEGLFQHTVNELIDQGLIEPKDRDLYRITPKGISRVESWAQHHQEEQEVRQLRRAGNWFPSEELEYLVRDYPKTRRRARVALWVALTAVAGLIIELVYLAIR